MMARVLAILLLSASVIGPIWAMSKPDQKASQKLSELFHQAGSMLEEEEEARDRSLDERIAATIRARTQGDIKGWAKAIMPKSFPLGFCPMHDYMIDTRHDQQTALEAPRGHSKTTFFSILMAMYQALNEPETYRHYLNIQSTGDKADAVNIAIRCEIEDNLVIREVYGDMVGKGKWTDSLFVLSNGIAFSAVGAGRSLRGIQYRTVRPDWINLDDLYDEDDINNPGGTQKKTEWFWGTLYPARSKMSKAKFNVQGTAINDEDILIKLEEDPNFKFKRFSAIMPDGKPLWPDLNSEEDLEKEKFSMGTVIFEREMQMERRNDATSIIKQAWLTDWEMDPSDFKTDSKSYEFIQAIVGVDPSIGKKKVNDPSAYMRVWKMIPLNLPSALPVFFIDSMVNERLSQQKRIDAAKEMVTTSRPDRQVGRMRVETISGFKDIGELIQKAVSVPCTLVDSVKDKITNMEKNSKYFENGRVFLNRHIKSSLKVELVRQLTNNFPKNDDMRDALFLTLDDKAGGWGTWV